MGCSSCSTTTTGGAPSGCQSNGTCGTSGCNKLNVYNWLSDMILPDGQKTFPVVEVRFKGSRKEFFKNVNALELKAGDLVAVEGNPGHDIGTVSIVGELVRLQLKKKNVDENSTEVKALYRHAKGYDIEKYEQVKTLEVNTMFEARTIALELGLQMKLSDVEYQGDGKKATFYYTADERVDFRELIKRLADKFKTRIEMRQISMRQEASRLGGIGSCGRELCCSTWLTDFKAVSTSAARYQNLSLNPIKLAGQCGKLKCCLNYELDSYMDAVKDFPDTNIKLEMQKGYAKHIKTDIFKRLMWYSFTSTERREDTFYVPDAWVPLSVDRVKEIIAMNKSGAKPDELKTDIEIEVKEKTHDYENVVGQDSITRLDKVKKKKGKSNKQGNKPQQAAAGQQQNQAREPRAQGQQQKPAQQNQNREPRVQGGQQQKPAQQNQNREQRPQGQQPKPVQAQQPKTEQPVNPNQNKEQRPAQQNQNQQQRNPQNKNQGQQQQGQKPQQQQGPRPQQQAQQSKPATPQQNPEPKPVQQNPAPAAPGQRQRQSPPPEN